MGYRDTGERLSTNYDYKEIPLIKLINTRPYASAKTEKVWESKTKNMFGLGVKVSRIQQFSQETTIFFINLYPV